MTWQYNKIRNRKTIELDSSNWYHGDIVVPLDWTLSTSNMNWNLSLDALDGILMTKGLDALDQKQLTLSGREVIIGGSI